MPEMRLADAEGAGRAEGVFFSLIILGRQLGLRVCGHDKGPLSST